MTILPLAYLPSVSYFTCLLHDECVVDLGEHFVKRSERNRARILATDGQPMRTVRLDYSKRWQHQHWGALVASYRSSPYFDHYASRFEPFYRREYEFLVDYDLELLEMLCTLTRIPFPRLCETYVEARPGDLDLRPRYAKDPAFAAESYFQVFSERMPFAPNLSFADLLFAEGPASVSVLGHCRRG